MPPLAQLVGVVLLLAEPGGLQGRSPSGPAELDWPGPRISFGAGEVVRAGYEAPAGPAAPAEAPLAKPGPPQADAESSRKPAPLSRSGTTPLSPPRQDKDKDKAQPRTGLIGGPSSWLNVGGSLALVLGLFFVLAWVMRKTTPGGCPTLPAEVVEVLGRAPLASRQQAYLIRLGRKLVLLSVTPAGVEPLSEVTEAEEVDRLAGLCRQGQPNSSTATFRQVFQQLAGKPTGRIR